MKQPGAKDKKGKTKIVHCVTMGNISHSETINEFGKDDSKTI